MKKLILFAVLLVGVYSTSQAQDFLQYKVKNASASDTWVVSLNDAGPTGIYQETLAPGGGATDGMPKFQFPLQYKIQSSSGCAAIGVLTGTTSSAGALISTSCPGVDVIYTLIMPKPNLYQLKMLFN